MRRLYSCPKCACEHHTHVSACVAAYLCDLRGGREKETEHVSAHRVIRPVRSAGHVCTDQFPVTATERRQPQSYPKGSYAQGLRFLLLPSLCFGHQPCEGKGLTRCRSAVKAQKHSHSDWPLRLMWSHRPSNREVEPDRCPVQPGSARKAPHLDGG